MAGQSDNRYGDRGRMPTVTEGVAAPTTATVGKLGDVRFDTDGVEWTLKKITGGEYTWLQTYPECVMNLILGEDQTTGNTGDPLVAGDMIKFIAQGYSPFTVNTDGSVNLTKGSYIITLGVRPSPASASGIIGVGIFENGDGEIGTTRVANVAIASAVITIAGQTSCINEIHLSTDTTIEAQFTTVNAITSILQAGTYMTIRRIS